MGKTTTKDLLSSLLATVGPTVAPVGSFNNEIGLPLTALRSMSTPGSSWLRWVPAISAKSRD